MMYKFNKKEINRFIEDTKKYVELRFKSSQNPDAFDGFDISADMLPFY